jgi:hypothetical protein
MATVEPKAKAAADFLYRACSNPECATVWQIKREQAKLFSHCATCGADLRAAR